MNYLFADRTKVTHKSFIREILKVTQDPEIISFAGGLPNPQFFPTKEMSRAAVGVLEEDGRNALQYSTSEGYYPLRKYIANRYFKKKGLKVDPDEILITNGSQQGLDLIGKVFLNKGDRLIIERPGYLGAIQAFSVFEPQFAGVPLLDDGVDTEELSEKLKENEVKMFYSVTNFQNPSGITYSADKRKETAEILGKYDTIFVEDDPYGELRFIGEDQPCVKQYLGEQGVLLGSFSKIAAPGLRMGWVCATEAIMEKLVVAKQATDLHSNYFTQRVLHRYLEDNEIESHISRIREAYGRQRNAMVSAIERYFPGEIGYTRPEGGMFLWVSLPEGISSMELFELAIKENVAFVPGNAFYVNGGGENTLRLNFSNSDEDRIEEGIRRLGKCIGKLLL